jgi:anti-anti-sigma factor
MTNHVSTVQDESQALIRPETDIVAASVAGLRSRLRGLIGAGVRDLVMDLSAVQMVDSAGLGLLISAHNSLRKAGGHLSVVHASPDVYELFRTMRIHQHFSVSAD